MKKITEEQRVEEYFMREPQPVCDAMLDKIRLILRLRNMHGAQPKRGRPPKEKSALIQGAAK